MSEMSPGERKRLRRLSNAVAGGEYQFTAESFRSPCMWEEASADLIAAAVNALPALLDSADRLADVEATLDYVNAVARGEVDEEPCKSDCNFIRFCGERCSRHCSRRPVGLLLRRIHDLEDSLRTARSKVQP